MRIRRKYIIVLVLYVICMITGLWIFWSPLANVEGDFTWRDKISIRQAVRTKTLKSILLIYERPDGVVMVHTGFQRSPLHGSGFVYELKKTKNGWQISEGMFWIS